MWICGLEAISVDFCGFLCYNAPLDVYNLLHLFKQITKEIEKRTTFILPFLNVIENPHVSPLCYFEARLFYFEFALV